MIDPVDPLLHHEGLRLGLVATAFGLGMRHGIDWDHIAAITDITGSQRDPRRGTVLSTIYAAGHAIVVLILGLAAIWAGGFIPASVDVWMEKIVGITLLLLGTYVFYALARRGKDFRMRSRWMLLISSVRRGYRWATGRRDESVQFEHEHEHDHGSRLHAHEHEAIATDAGTQGRAALALKVDSHVHPHRHAGAMPADPFMAYGVRSAFGIGALHGIGAETPTQVLIFLAAAGAAGAGAGAVLLVAFILGVFVTNTLIALASAFGYLNAARHWPVYATIAIVTGVFSVTVGLLFLLGRGDVLPAGFGG